MDKKKYGASEKMIRELHDNNLYEFKSVIRLTPEQFEELLLMTSPVITRNDIYMRPVLPARLNLEIII